MDRTLCVNISRDSAFATVGRARRAGSLGTCGGAREPARGSLGFGITHPVHNTAHKGACAVWGAVGSSISMGHTERFASGPSRGRMAVILGLCESEYKPLQP